MFFPQSYSLKLYTSITQKVTILTFRLVLCLNTVESCICGKYLFDARLYENYQIQSICFIPQRHNSIENGNVSIFQGIQHPPSPLKGRREAVSGDVMKTWSLPLRVTFSDEFRVRKRNIFLEMKETTEFYFRTAKISWAWNLQE